MKIALISTVFNEGASIARWINALRAQTVQPDEFVIADGGSKDRTVSLLKQGFEPVGFPKPRIIVQRCNIAEGRNLAIRNTASDVVVSLDAGSVSYVGEHPAALKPARVLSAAGALASPGMPFKKNLRSIASRPKSTCRLVVIAVLLPGMWLFAERRGNRWGDILNG